MQDDLRLLVSRANQETTLETNYLTGVPQLDYYLENEIRNATNMLYNLRNTQGEENIPKELLDIAKGVVFLTILKAGFMFTGRYGTGLVVAKLHDGTWSAPSAITVTGMGWGLQIGAEVTEVMLILSSDAAVDAFKSRAQVSVGAELGVSVGPIGRALASDVTAGNKGAAHAFSYAHSKGLFFGASLEASAIASRPDVNRTFYGQKISPSVLLSGEYPKPRGAKPLYDALDEILGMRGGGFGGSRAQDNYGAGLSSDVYSNAAVAASTASAAANAYSTYTSGPTTTTTIGSGKQATSSGSSSGSFRGNIPSGGESYASFHPSSDASASSSDNYGYYNSSGGSGGTSGGPAPSRRGEDMVL
jgi:lipid-binding SYLF domain-containing protein